MAWHALCSQERQSHFARKCQTITWVVQRINGAVKKAWSGCGVNSDVVKVVTRSQKWAATQYAELELWRWNWSHACTSRNFERLQSMLSTVIILQRMLSGYDCSHVQYTCRNQSRQNKNLGAWAWHALKGSQVVLRTKYVPTDEKLVKTCGPQKNSVTFFLSKLANPAWALQWHNPSERKYSTLCEPQKCLFKFDIA